MKKKIISKLKSPVVWLTVISQIALIIALFNENTSAEFKTIATVVVEILTTFGIMNNPDNKSGF